MIQPATLEEPRIALPSDQEASGRALGAEVQKQLAPGGGPARAPGSGAILSVGALLQAAATVGRLLAAAGDPDATGHRNDGGSRPADLGGGAARAADDGGGAAGDARGTGRGLGGRRSR